MTWCAQGPSRNGCSWDMQAYGFGLSYGAGNGVLDRINSDLSWRIKST